MGVYHSIPVQGGEAQEVRQRALGWGDRGLGGGFQKSRNQMVVKEKWDGQRKVRGESTARESGGMG